MADEHRGEMASSRPIKEPYSISRMLTEQADRLLRLNYQTDYWTIDALQLQCARQAAMIAALAGKNATQRLELRRLNRVLARRAARKKPAR